MRSKKPIYIIHAAIWMVMFLFPLTFVNHGGGVSLRQFIFMSVAPLSLMITFYANYLWLAPKHYAEGDKRFYWVANALIIVGLGLGIHYWMENMHDVFLGGERVGKRPPEQPQATIIFMLRDMFNIAIAAAIATTIQLASRWHSSESARQEAESARAKAELKNLRSQVNPHFLLNTLNNIYALIAFNQDKAQEAVAQLSKLLRHVLYDNEQQYVPLTSEVEFLGHYISLMKIRLAANVDVKMHTKLPEPCNAKIAPLLLISLVENAFKHGVSPTEPSYIHIYIEADGERIVCRIANSNFPKAETDRSGHGIGLKQVAARLNLLYPGAYQWHKGVSEDKREYKSELVISGVKEGF